MAVPAPPSSPVGDSYARLTAALPTLHVEHGAPRHGDGWVSSARLAGDGTALRATIAVDEAQALRDYGQTPRPEVAASFCLHRYAWHACLLVTAPWFLQRRVPRLPVEHVSWHRGEGRMTALVEEFACLPGDPAAALPGARVVGDEEALRAAVRASLAEHLEPLLAAFGPHLRRRSRALWGMATDEVAEGLWYFGHLLGEEDRAVAELGALLPGSTPPFAGGAGFRSLPGPDGSGLRTRTRIGCCLFYTLRPADTCVTCPRLCDAERTARLSAA
ncbi:(2Fe-2S)-binding protein [Streptomyces sp. HB2AG]|uniref:(2Fe-2S)-binding protein n=1 Tax=Streptomyces sp. HB2AG TaxID=2983400 RepID=UPI0022AAEA8E|nr:(2Fe-2S)-binding protein [Streptomyces sp. HB2AG]MCZ2525462.1 (2Fe-2S)-binding protein [Streptomyces sp. HB2AG]